jgi:hypothetical protein
VKREKRREKRRESRAKQRELGSKGGPSLGRARARGLPRGRRVRPGRGGTTPASARPAPRAPAPRPHHALLNTDQQACDRAEGDARRPPRSGPRGLVTRALPHRDTSRKWGRLEKGSKVTRVTEEGCRRRAWQGRTSRSRITAASCASPPGAAACSRSHSRSCCARASAPARRPISSRAARACSASVASRIRLRPAPARSAPAPPAERQHKQQR